MSITNNDDSDLRRERLFDVAKEPQCILLPIEGHEKKPLVSVEEAIKPLVDIVSDIERKTYVAKQSCKQFNDGLTVDESSAIRLYTMGWHPNEKSLYFCLNKYLRDKQRDNLKPWFLYLKLILTGLEKLPSLTCIAFRGVKMNLSERYPIDLTFIWWGFSSCTLNANILQKEHFLGKTGDRTLFVIECYSGKDIHQHSYYEHENEILLPPARQFRVVASVNLGNGLHLIQIKEIQPKFSLIEPICVNNNQIQFPLEIIKQNEHIDQKINKYQHSTRINLTFENLTDQDMPIVVNQAILSKASTEIDLSNNQIKSEGLFILSSVLYKNTTLQVLSLLSNEITDEGIRSLSDVLSSYNSTLTTLGLGSNQITDQGVQYLSQMLTFNRTLTVLTLQNNKISSRGVELLMNTLTHSNSTLTILNLSSNILIDNSCVQSIIQMFNNNQTLREFYMIKCNLSTTNIKTIQQITKLKRNFEFLV